MYNAILPGIYCNEQADGKPRGITEPNPLGGTPQAAIDYSTRESGITGAHEYVSLS
jgi:hypothetical protein